MAQIKNRPPFLPRAFLRLLLKGEELAEFSGDVDEIYRQLCENGALWKAKLWYSLRVLESAPGLFLDNILWRSIMLRNYFKTALRNIRKHKGHSLINIAGFAIGMACCLVILIYVRQELSYDSYHRDLDRLYRVAVDIRTQTANRVFAPICPMAGPTLKSDFPQVEAFVRIFPARGRLVKRNEISFYEDLFMYADESLFEVLTIPFLSGDPQTALSQPLNLVISQRMANKYFGAEDPLGETLDINGRDFKITGIVQSPPENTHLKYDLIASLNTLSDWNELTNWHSTMFYTYVKLAPNVNAEDFEGKMTHMADKYIKKLLDEWGVEYRFFLQPLAGIHLNSHIRYEIEPSGNPDYLYILSLVGLLTLLIAGFNFMNLSTARAVNRSNEVGMRKVVGALKPQLITQFLGESLLLAMVSLILAIFLARFAVPLLNNRIGTSLDLANLFHPAVLFSILGGGILVGLAAGLYPAFVLSGFKPVTSLKASRGARPKGIALRTALVVLQFAVSVALIVGTLTMYRQFNYMKNQHLGFDKEQKLVIPLRGGISITENYESVKDVFTRLPSVTAATLSSSVPGRGVSNFAIELVGEENDMNQSMFHLYFDHDFIPNYGINMVAGRAFQKDMSTDIRGAFLINQAAVKALGWSRPQEALGKRLRTGMGSRVNPIIGVTEDFHYRGLQNKVEPLVMEFMPDIFRNITLTVDTSDVRGTLAAVERQWKTLFPGNPLEHFFLDTDFDRQYQADEQVGRIFSIFTYLGLFVACLGLLGLASFTAESRTKEIGIRKVLGASVPGIILMLSKQFTRWVLIAIVIAWPPVYYFMSRWLDNFAYRTGISFWIFVLSGALTLVVALLIVSYQSFRAASTDPANTLRYE